MKTQELILNIAVNLGRIGRFIMEGRPKRVNQFLTDTESYIQELDNNKISDSFKPTLKVFKQKFDELKNQTIMNDELAEEAFTWANILQHRAKLA